MPKPTRPIIQAEPLFVDREHAAAALGGISDSTLEALVRSGDLPPPRRISQGRTGWLYRELREWAESRPVSDQRPGPGRRRSPPDGAQAA
jgi:prophage regulatory protein